MIKRRLQSFIFSSNYNCISIRTLVEEHRSAEHAITDQSWYYRPICERDRIYELIKCYKYEGRWVGMNEPRRCSWGKTGLDVANCKRSTSQGILGDSIPPKNPPAPDRSENCWSDFTAIPAFVLRGITLRQLRAITAILRSNTVSEKMDQHQGRRDFSESRQSHTVWCMISGSTSSKPSQKLPTHTLSKL